MPPKIAIALAGYKPDLNFFLAQLQSIATQSFQDWICFISFDSPLSEVRSDLRFSSFFNDHRFRWSENQKPLGHLKNFEVAIGLAANSGALSVACCDQDDVWFSHKLEVSFRELRKLGANALVFSDMKVIDAQGNISEKNAWDIEKRGVKNCGSFDLFVRNVVPGTGMLMDVNLIKRHLSIPAEAIYHDHWFALVAAKEGVIKPLYEALYAYRVHGANVVGVTPFTGILRNKKGEELTLVSKALNVWKRSRSFVSATQAKGLKLSVFEKIAFLSRWDLGFILFARGILSLSSDPALARACFGRALGKLMDCLLFWRNSATS